MKKCSTGAKWFALVIFVGFFIVSCGGGGSSTTEQADSSINGVWKSDDGDVALTINFNGEKKTIEMDGKIMPATIESDTDRQMVVKVQEDAEKIETWTFTKVWNDNGSSFTFVLTFPDGRRENLKLETQS